MKTILLILIFTGFLALKGQSPVPQQVSIYPNPASSSINITFTEPLKSDISVTISDILGNKIETLKFSADALVHIDLDGLNLKNGIYLVKIETGDQSFLKKLLIKS